MPIFDYENFGKFRNNDYLCKRKSKITNAKLQNFRKRQIRFLSKTETIWKNP